MLRGITINLLPKEVVLLEQDRDKRSTRIKICLAALSVVTLLSLVTIFVRLLQTRQLVGLQNDLSKVESEVSAPDLKEKEGLATYLKKHLEVIQGILGTESLQAKSFMFINRLLPDSISISTFSVDSKGTVSLSGETANLRYLENFFDDLTDETNSKNVASINLDNLSRAVTGNFRFDLIIAVK